MTPRVGAAGPFGFLLMLLKESFAMLGVRRVDVTSSQIVGPYRDPSPPRTLWRIDYGLIGYGSIGLGARKQANFTGVGDFLTEMLLHFDWNNWQPTSFVSLFSDWEHAVNFALKLKQNKRGYVNIVIHELITAYVGPVFRVVNLINHFQLQVDLKRSTYEDEYLALNQIYQASVFNTIPMSDWYLDSNGFRHPWNLRSRRRGAWQQDNSERGFYNWYRYNAEVVGCSVYMLWCGGLEVHLTVTHSSIPYPVSLLPIYIRQ